MVILCKVTESQNRYNCAAQVYWEIASAAMGASQQAETASVCESNWQDLYKTDLSLVSLDTLVFVESINETQGYAHDTDGDSLSCLHER